MASFEYGLSLSGGLVYDDVVEAHVCAEAFDVRIHRTRWRNRGMADFKASMSFIEMMLGPTGLVSATYDQRSGQDRLVRLGDVTFIPKDAVLHCRAVPGSQRTLSCLFDIDRLAARTGLAWEWPDFDREEALDTGNEYIRMGLRRIAEELLAPGFASTAQIECSLLFIAMELLRVLRGSAPAECNSSARLDRRELARLCEMVIDPKGDIQGLGELAADLGMCSRTLASAFRRTTGKTFRSFLAEARVEKAKTLLGDRRMLIKQVAFDCGFRSCAAFSAAFRKATGLTPENYRAAIGA